MLHARDSLRSIMVVTIFIIVLPLLFPSNQNPEINSLWQGSAKWLGFVLMFGLAASFWMLTKPAEDQARPNIVLLLVAFQFVTVFLFSVELMFFLAFELPLVLRPIVARRWITFFVLAFFSVWLFWLPASAPNYLEFFSDPGFREQVMELVSIIAFILFAFFAGYVLMNESSMRSELEVAQSKLRQQAKIEERHIISRELHDNLGHHLVTLKVQLEVIKRNASNEVRSKVLQAAEIVQVLINDLRGVVEDMRERQLTPMPIALDEMLGGIVNPETSLKIARRLPTLPSEIHTTIFRCVQECLTNSIKHSGATQLNVELDYDGDKLMLSVRDNGRGTDKLERGNGLLGLAERASLVGGTLDIDTTVERGFSIGLTIPFKESL